MVQRKRRLPDGMFGWDLRGPLNRAQLKPKKKISVFGTLLIAGRKTSSDALKKALPKGLYPWRQEEKKSSFAGDVETGPLHVVKLKEKHPEERDYGYHDTSSYGHSRDHVGPYLAKMEGSKIKDWQVTYLGDDAEEALGALVGLGLASYRYLIAIKAEKEQELNLHLEGFDKETLDAAVHLVTALNLARHLVNVPPNILHPGSYADAVVGFFEGQPGVKVDDWSGARLKKEKMGLMLAVGQAAENGPHMVHIRYRPAKALGNPIAFVGKGITFDTGGLDIKPPAFMRYMKKDMGGSAALVGLAYWAVQNKLPLALDFYLAIAENAVGSTAFRPSDVVLSRNGRSVEIHNTDAEGRLVLADVMDVAVKQEGKNKPGLLIDVATLTGVARAALGADIGALFTTQTALGEELARAGQRSGDHLWPLPLYNPYEAQLKTTLADVNHCSSGAYGGAITAALFLRSFVGKVPWAHLDIMAWSEKTSLMREAGGSGQAVQCLATFLLNKVTALS